MHIHIATVGTNEGPITKVLNYVSGIDKLYLLYTDEKLGERGPSIEGKKNMPTDHTDSVNFIDQEGMMNNANENQYEKIVQPSPDISSLEVASYVEQSYLSSIPEIYKIKVPFFDFKGIVKTIFEIYEDNNGKGVDFSINITGGNRLMSCAGCYSSYYIHATMYYATHSKGSIKDQVLEIEAPMAVDIGRFKPITRDILRYIYENEKKGHVTSHIIRNHCYKDKIIDKQTVAYHVSLLKKSGLVKVIEPDRDEIKDGRVKWLGVTANGAMLVSHM